MNDVFGMIDAIKGDTAYLEIENFPERFHDVEQAIQILKSYKSFGNAIKGQGINNDENYQLFQTNVLRNRTPLAPIS